MSRYDQLVLPLPILLSGCLGGGSSPASSAGAPAPAVVQTAATLPAGVSVSSLASSDGQGNISVSGPTIDPEFSLSTIGSVGKLGTTGNVAKITISGINTAVAGNSLTLTHGSGGEAIDNGPSYTDAYNDSGLPEDFRTKSIYVSTVATDPATPNTTVGSAALPYQASYLTFGGWTDSNSAFEPPVGVGFFVFGDATQPNNIPSIGTATYTGFSSGIANDQDYESFSGGSSQEWGSSANMTAVANFFTRSIDFSTTETVVPVTNLDTNVTNVVQTPQLDMTGTLTYTANVNLFSGSVTDAGGRSGTATGRFYGPAAEEVGGVYSLGTTENGHTGVFAGKK